MKIRIADFKGEIPRRSARLLPDNVATISSNARLDDGNIIPYRGSDLVHTFDAAAQDFYKHNDEWLSFNAFINAAPGPVAQDRLYYTRENGAPRVLMGGSDYPLAVPTPADSPTVALVGTLIDDLAQTVLYAYTFVTEFDEESAPSPLSSPLLWSAGTTVDLSSMTAAPAGRGIDRRRIYRSQTSASGITDLYFVAEIPATQTTYSHDPEANPLQEVLSSANYDPPVDTLQGLTSLPNGMMAAFSGKRLFFCEPFIPHAWPDKYSLTVDYDIVALAAFGSTLAILTKGTPYVAQGSAPENMVMERMEINLPCIAARGVVDLGYAAAYPSNEGLVVITATGAQLASRNLFTRDDWLDLSPSTFFAARYDGRYAFGFVDGNIDNVVGGDPALDPAPANAFDGGNPTSAILGYVNYDGGDPFTSDAINAIGFIDLTGEQPHFLRTNPEDTGSPDQLFRDPLSGEMFLLTNGTEVLKFDARNQRTSAYKWRSKLFMAASPVSFSAVLVETNTTEAETVLKTRVYADGKLVRETDHFDRYQRLPGGFRAKEWQVEVEGNAEVTSIALGETLDELAVP